MSKNVVTDSVTKKIREQYKKCLKLLGYFMAISCVLCLHYAVLHFGVIERPIKHVNKEINIDS